MTKELIIQSVNHKDDNVFVDFMCNGIWCKTAIEPLKYTRYLIEECGIMAQRKDFKKWIIFEDLLDDYIFHALHNRKRPLQFVILDEYHYDLSDVSNLISKCGITLNQDNL